MQRLLSQLLPVSVCALLGVVSTVSAVELQPKMGAPLNGLSVSELALFMAGRTEFDRIPTVAEGRGPILNQNSCGGCHSTPLGGSGTITVTRFGFFDEKNGGFDPLEQYGGSLLQAESIFEGCEETVSEFANVIAHRITSSTLGLGLIEAIPDSAIIANANPSGVRISGRVHMVAAAEDPPNSPLRAGRFGWKAQVATVLTFSADAARNEMGITNPLFPTENDPNGINPPSLEQCDTVPDPEDHPDSEGFLFIDRLTHFQRYLAAPPQTPRSGMTGETLFGAVGCTACHIASFTTADNAELEPALRNKVIRPYSDFLLHDMGILGDGIAQGEADVREIRTPPLWGLRMRTALLHDGRMAAGTFESRVIDAIEAHGGFGSEAVQSALLFAALPAAQKSQIVAFLDSLGRSEFDSNGDLAIDPIDLQAFRDCYQAGGAVTPDMPCAIHDVDQDGDVDDADFGFFLTVYSGTIRDCNANSVSDPRDILLGTSNDCNHNGVPDECDPDSSNVQLFVAVLLGEITDPVARCMLDKNRDSEVDGRDIQPFADALTAP